MTTQHASDPDRPNLSNRIRYHLDLFLSQGTWARFVGLFILSATGVFILGSLVWGLAGQDAEVDGNFFEAIWWSTMRLLDAGNMADDKGTVLRAISLAITFFGVLVVALLIGLVGSTVEEKIEDLRRGKSPVIDNDHTLILGFSEKVFPILRELREANASRRHASIVVLSTQEKSEVEEAIRERLGDMKTTRVIVRQGSPYSPQDLRKVGAGRARSIIVPAIEAADKIDSSEEEASIDMSAIKTLLALRRVPGALSHNHVVVELTDNTRAPVVKHLGGAGVEVVAMRETLARLMVQTSRQSGLAQVYRDLLTYDGSEFYFKNFPELKGMSFGKVFSRMRGAIPVGVRRISQDGKVDTIINPDVNLTLGATDELLVLAEDDDTFGLMQDHSNPVLEALHLPPTTAATPKAERFLICGYRSDLMNILGEFELYVAAGSEVHIMATGHESDLASIVENSASLKKLKVSALSGDPSSPASLADAVKTRYDAILIVANDTLEPQESDAHTVITLLLLREMAKQADQNYKPRIISEILDPRTKELVASDDSLDFVVSSEITSMLLAQVSERRELNAVFADLFDSDGNEVYLKNIAAYATLNEPISWQAVQKIAQMRGEVAIGCFRAGHDPIINPHQNVALVFGPKDKLVVVAQDDREGSPLPKEMYQYISHKKAA